jgi:ABC-2 type transport system ATP-binding protein
MIRIEELTIKYGELTAVRAVTLTVPAGSVFGLVGPNGAGKTSLMRVLAGLLPPAAGRCFIGEIDVLEDPLAAHRVIGYMPDFFGVYDHLQVWEYLEFFGELYGLRGEHLRRRLDETLELSDLTIKKEAYIGGLSRGMKQRLCLARTLVHEPQVLLLDEPASGVDPRGRWEMRQLLRRLGDLGKTIFVSSHILPELSDLCDSIAIMEKGNLLAAGPVESIATELGVHRALKIAVLNGEADRVPQVLEGLQWLQQVQVQGDQVEIQLADSDEAIADTLERLVQSGLRIGGINQRRTDLEQLYLQLTHGELA